MGEAWYDVRLRGASTYPRDVKIACVRGLYCSTVWEGDCDGVGVWLDVDGMGSFDEEMTRGTGVT